MSGWGTWASNSNVNLTKNFLNKKRTQNESVAAIISNAKDKKFSSNYEINSLPYHIAGKEQLEILQSSMINENNSLTTYKKLIQPKTVSFVGKIINPNSIEKDEFKTSKLSEIIEKQNRKIVRTKAKL